MVLTSVMTLALLSYTAGFREGDWVNYTDFRFVSSVAMDMTTVYFGTSNGVIRYDRFDNRWLDPMTVTDGLPDPRVTNIAYDQSQDRVWVNTPLGVAYYQPTFEEWFTGIDFPSSLARNDFRAGALGVLTTDFGYTYLNGALTDINSQSFQLTRGADDGFNHLFTGTMGLGPVVISPRYGSLQRIPYGLYTEDASALIRIGDKFWIGGGPGEGIQPGLTLCDTNLQQWQWHREQFTRGLASAYITSAVDDGNTTWLGTDNGVVRYDNQNGEFRTVSIFAPFATTLVTSLAADSAWIYIGTDNGVGYLSRAPQKKGKNQNKRDKASVETVQTTADSSRIQGPLIGMGNMRGWYIYCLKVIGNYLYVGTDHGAVRHLAGSKAALEAVNTPDNLLSTDVIDIIPNGDSLIFATKTDLIIMNTRTGQSVSLTKLEHFGQWRIREIVADKKYIWAATDAGLWMYRLSDGYERQFTTADGMISDNVRSIEMLGDYLWMATPKGVIRFYWNRSGRVY